MCNTFDNGYTVCNGDNKSQKKFKKTKVAKNMYEESKVGQDFIGTRLRKFKTARRGRCVLKNKTKQNKNMPVTVAPACNPST